MADRPMIVFGDGNQTRDFLYVSESARGILMAGISDQAVGETINVGFGKEITIEHLAWEVADVVGKPDAEVAHEEVRPGDTLRLYADISKAEELLGFEPQVTLKEGLSLLRDWYMDMDESPEVLLEEEQIFNWERND